MAPVHIGGVPSEALEHTEAGLSRCIRRLVVTEFVLKKRELVVAESEIVASIATGGVPFHESLGESHRIAAELAASRVILFSSRWEGSPHAAFEAFATGASVVGPPLPCFSSWCGDGAFGTVARDRRPASLASALALEMEAWRSGVRSGHSISGHWRPRLQPAQVCGDMLEAAGLS